MPNHPLLPRHVRTTALAAADDLVLGRSLLFGNDDVRISFVSAAGPSGLYRNSAGDEAVYIQHGSAVFESVYGTITARSGRLHRGAARDHSSLAAAPIPA